MNQRCRLERLPWFFLGQFRGRKSPKLRINKWQKLGSGSRLALFNPRQNMGHVGHATTGYAATSRFPRAAQ
jgi:hypothetical protein